MNEEREELLLDEPEEEVNMDWLFTFADMIMLMFATFVLLYAMSTPDLHKIDSALSSVVQALGGKSGPLRTEKLSEREAVGLVDQVLLQKQIRMAQQKVFADFKAMQAQKGLEGLVGVHFDEALIILRIPGDVLFARGETALSDRGRQIVESMKDFFVQHPDQVINIRGYTDDLAPPPGSRFHDNWELSSLRAVGVLRLLMQMGVEPKRLTSTGLADMNPLYPNTTEEYRAQNRRVEFVLEKRVGGK